jgi:methylisocitrate lyase
MKKFVHPGRLLRDQMKQKCVMMPGSFNGLVARMTADLGF